MFVRKCLTCFVCISLILFLPRMLIKQSQTNNLNNLEVLQTNGPYTRVVNKTTPARVQGDFYYSTIQSAVIAANDNDTIIVCPGTYVENVEIEYMTSLNIYSYIGQQVTCVDASVKTYPGFAAGRAYYVNISRFTVTNAVGLYAGSPNAGIFLLRADHNAISDNDLLCNIHGIFFEESNDNTIENNKIRSNNDSGVWLYDSCNNNAIRYNTIVGNDLGIYLDDDVTPCTDNTISYNDFIGNNYGIHIKGSNNNTIITYNNFRRNQYHIYLGSGVSPSVGSITVQYNSFFDRGQYIFYNNQSADTTATYNWWGTTNETLIDEWIYDKNDDPSLGEVIYKPYLTAPVAPIINHVDMTSTLEVTANITYPTTENVSEEISNVQLHLSIEDSDWLTMEMNYNPISTLYASTIPAYNQLANKTLQYYVTAKDNIGNTVTSETLTYILPLWTKGDINRDGKVDIKDIAFAAKNFGQPF